MLMVGVPIVIGAAATEVWPAAMLDPANAPPTPPAAKMPSQIHFLWDLFWCVV